MQLEFFPLTREEELEIEVKQLRETCDKVRKKLFAQNRELTKMYVELHIEFEELKRCIARGQENGTS